MNWKILSGLFAMFSSMAILGSIGSALHLSNTAAPIIFGISIIVGLLTYHLVDE